MIARVVNMKCITGMEDKLRLMCLENLVPINKEAGCIEVYFLEPNIEDDNPFFGVISIWENKNVLNNMKNSEKYHSLLQNLNPLVESVTDSVFVISANI
jgi:quinol monooxygenase YgiN